MRALNCHHRIPRWNSATRKRPCLIKKLEKGTEDVDTLIRPIDSAYLARCKLDLANTDDYLISPKAEVIRGNSFNSAAWHALQRCIKARNNTAREAQTNNANCTGPTRRAERDKTLHPRARKLPFGAHCMGQTTRAILRCIFFQLSEPCCPTTAFACKFGPLLDRSITAWRHGPDAYYWQTRFVCGSH